MKTMRSIDLTSAGARAGSQRGHALVILLVLVAFFLGLGIGASWRSHEVPVDRGVTMVDPAVASASMSAPAPKVPKATKVDTAAVESVKRVIPNVEGATVESGTRILRKNALEEFQQTVQELKARQKEAEVSFMQANEKLSPEERKAAAKKLLELKAEGFERLKQIAANSQAQIEALQELKRAPQ